MPPPGLPSPNDHSPLLVLDLGLDIVDSVGGLDLKGDGLPRKGLDEDLHLHVRSTSRIVCLGTAALTAADGECESLGKTVQQQIQVAEFRAGSTRRT